MKQDWLEELLTSTGTAKVNERQARVLEAAVEMFSEKGYAATSTNEIAKKAGVAEGTIFRYYKTKKELLLAVVTPVLTKVAAPFIVQSFAREVLDGSYESYEQLLRTIIRNRFEFAKTNLPIIKIVLQEVPFQSELKEGLIQVVEEEVYSRLHTIVEHFQGEGQIIDLPPATVIRLTVSTVIGFFLTRFLLLPELDWDDETEIEHTIQFIMYGLTPRRSR